MLALGSVVSIPARPLEDTEFYCEILDFYDHWNEIDPRLAEHHVALSRWSEAFGNDLVNLATHADLILHWLDPSRIREDHAVIVVSSVTEAFIVSIRAACDAVAAALSYVASDKPGQAPRGSLRALIKWSEKNRNRVRKPVAKILAADLDWFWRLRSIRDYLVHDGCRANIQCDGRQFNLWVHSARDGWVLRTPLLPLLRTQFLSLTSLANLSAKVIKQELALPDDRNRSRVVSGVLVPSLHRLVDVADRYAEPSP